MSVAGKMSDMDWELLVNMMPQAQAEDKHGAKITAEQHYSAMDEDTWWEFIAVGLTRWS